MGGGGDMHRRLRVSGMLVIFGLLVEALCLLWSRPIAFVVLVGLGGLLIASGILLFLYSLVSVTHPSAGEGEHRHGASPE